MIKLQVTLFDKNNKYKPVSVVIPVESMEYYENNKKEVQERAIKNICHYRYTTWEALKSEGYTLIKIREYDLEKIAQQKKIAQLKKLIAKRNEKKF